MILVSVMVLVGGALVQFFDSDMKQHWNKQPGNSTQKHSLINLTLLKPTTSAFTRNPLNARLVNLFNCYGNLLLSHSHLLYSCSAVGMMCQTFRHFACFEVCEAFVVLCYVQTMLVLFADYNEDVRVPSQFMLRIKDARTLIISASILAQSYIAL